MNNWCTDRAATGPRPRDFTEGAVREMSKAAKGFSHEASPREMMDVRLHTYALASLWGN